MTDEPRRPDANRQDRLERLYDQAFAMPAAEREAFLDEACLDDPALRDELASLLAEGRGAQTFMQDLGRLVEPTGEGAPGMLAEALVHRYAIEETVGKGGMATVYRARDLRHERQVALKVLKPELAAMVGSERFLAEIKTTAGLQHQGILPLFDSGEADGYLFYVMPYVEGESLRERLQRERQLPVEEAVGIAIGMAEAMDYAHRQGVIHRDLKPDNVLLREGRPVITDFGIALAFSAGGGGRLTETGLSLGTPHYMSPEQAAGDQNVGPSTDIYALGCVLYEMLVGEPPFTGSTPQAVLGRIITGEVEPLTARRRTVPPNVDSAVQKALEKVPADRFRSGAAFAAALASPSFGGARRQAGRGGGRAPRWTRVAGYGFAATLGALLTWWIADPGQTTAPSPMRVSTQLPPGQELVGPEQLRLSSDGSMLVYTGPGGGDGGWRLWAHRWTSGIGRPIPNTAGVIHFDPSPHNDEVALVLDGSLRVQALESDAVRTLVTAGAHCCVTWGDEGDWIYYTNGERGVSRVSPRGGEPEALTTPADGSSHEWPSPIRGTNLVLFERAGLFGVGSRIAVLDLASGDARELIEGSNPTPSGELILYTTEGSLPELRYLGDITEEAAATTIATSVGGDIVDGRAAFDVSRRHLVYAGSDRPGFSPLGTPVWVERDGTAIPVDSTLVMPLARVRVSPDGSRLLLSGLSGRATSTIHVKELPDGALALVTPPEELNHRPFWAPDGSAIYYTAVFLSGERRQGDTVLATEIRRVRSDGGAEPEPVGLPWPEATITRDGEWWVYRTMNDPGDADLWAVRTTPGSDPIPLVETEAQESQAAVSRDGRWLAYSSDRTGARQVYVRPFPETGSNRVQVTSRGGMSPAFSPADDELFVVEDGWMVALSYATEPTFRVTNREPLFDVSSYSMGDWTQAHDYDVTVDGRFMMTRRLESSESAQSRIVFLLDYLSTLAEAAR